MQFFKLKHKLMFLFLINVMNEITGGRISMFTYPWISFSHTTWLETRVISFTFVWRGWGRPLYHGDQYTPLSLLYIPVILCTYLHSLRVAEVTGEFKYPYCAYFPNGDGMFSLWPTLDLARDLILSSHSARRFGCVSKINLKCRLGSRHEWFTS